MPQLESQTSDPNDIVTDSLEQPTTFVSHASEDKPIVRNLVDTLIRYGVKVWFDEYEITIGDPIRRKLNEGLSKSRYGVVVLSQAFFEKLWTQLELDTLVSLLGEGKLLPLLYGITIEEVRAKDPMLATIRAEPLSNVKRAASLIATKIKGENIPVENGVRVYREQTISASDLILTEGLVLEKTRFESCKIQGPIIFVEGGPIDMNGSYLDQSMFMTLPNRMWITGGIGIRDVQFIGCRFKDVGFMTSRDVSEDFANATHIEPEDVPEHLR